MKIGKFETMDSNGGIVRQFYGAFLEDFETVMEIPEEFFFSPSEIKKWIDNNFYDSKKFDIAGLKFLPPVAPSKIVAVGLNYRDHAAEMNKKLPETPLLFIKPSTSVIAHMESIIIPEASARVDYESELAVVIGKTAKNVKKEAAADYILGYTCMNDVTARDLQVKDIQYTRAKGFDTFAPVGPFIETGIQDPSNLSVKGYLNGALKQNSSTANLIFDIPFLIEFISSVMTLLPGDVISTGTPSGIGKLHRGDRFDVEIEKVGKLTSFVA